MPAWSPEIANEFIRIASMEGRTFNQMELQKLVYIAHGWCLAYSGEPLTGDRPEAWVFGPVYKRLSDALAGCGSDPVIREIETLEIHPRWAQSATEPADVVLNSSEMDMIAMVYEDYGRLGSSQLSSLTQREGTPWALVFADGKGEFRDIPHHLVKAQFVEFAKEGSEEPSSRV